jgi:hypothetical protein
MTETPGLYKDSSGNAFKESTLEVQKATKLVVEALGGFHWRCDYLKFCEILDFEPSDYAEQKYQEFQELISYLNKFDLQSITKIVQEGTELGNA